MIARGISIGGDLDQVDEVTLGRSIADRKPYEQSARR
jgi:recombination protein RecR